MENLEDLCLEYTKEIVDSLESKYYFNGKEKTIGDLVLYVLITEDNNSIIVPINLNDLNDDYKFTGKFYNMGDTYFKLPIIEGKIVKPKDTSLREFNYYLSQFPTNTGKLCASIIE